MYSNSFDFLRMNITLYIIKYYFGYVNMFGVNIQKLPDVRSEIAELYFSGSIAAKLLSAVFVTAFYFQRSFPTSFRMSRAGAGSLPR